MRRPLGWLRDRRSAIEAVPGELRSAYLLLDLNLRGPLSLALMRRAPVPGRRPVAGVAIRSRTVRAPGGRSVPIVVFDAPSAASPGPARGALIWIHGGGTVLGDARQSGEWCSTVARDLGIPVLSVDYRLAPEHPFPAALDDCFDALAWLHAAADELGVDRDRIVIGGDSAGGGLAATTAQRAYDHGIPLALQLLLYPMLDDRTPLRDDDGRHRFVWTSRSNRFAWTSYLGRTPCHEDARPYVSAARRQDLGGLAPAWIGVGDLDLFCEEDERYAGRLVAAGVRCRLEVVPGMYHGADLFARPGTTAVTALRSSTLAALREAVG